MIKRILSIGLLNCLSHLFLFSQPESWYITEIASSIDGQTEVPVENGRIDIVTSTHAIEVERASNWKHSIGQCLWYALQTNKEPGIILIMESIADRKHGIRLQSALDYAGLGAKVKVWFYPEDFGGTYESIENSFNEEKKSIPGATSYWFTSSSGMRHNAGCRWFTNSKGRYCIESEGKPCGTCGG